MAQRRRLRAVESLHLLAASPRRLLCDIAEVAASAIRSDYAAIALQGEDGFTVIGGHGLEGGLLPLRPRPLEHWSADGIAEDHAQDGTASTLSAAIRHDGQIVGLIATGSRSPIGSYDTTERDILLRLARVTEAAIRSEATLARLAAEAFRALERCRLITGAQL